jgi:restriction system protein
MDTAKIIIDSLKPFVWIIVLLGVIGILIELFPVFIERWRRDKKYFGINQIYSDRNLLLMLRGLKPAEFEDYIGYLFNKLGFTTELLGGSHDGGVDVVATKDNIKHYIQCKKFITSQVAVSDVRDFYGSLVDHLIDGKGYFITTNKFTLEAEKFAEDKPIELIDGHRLIKYIRLAQGEDGITSFKKEVINSEKCPRCGGNLIEKRGKFGKFFGCSNYPKCRFTKKF